MKILVVDDNKQYAARLCEYFSSIGEFDFGVVVPDNKDTIASLANNLKEAIPAEGILLININASIGKEGRQSHKGIELLTWLRIKNILSHCVLYSFQSAEAIARANENNRLLFSQGTTFVRLPFSFDFFTKEKLKKLCKEIARAEDIRNCVKPLFDIGEFRHRDANWWGIKQLWDVHLYTAWI